MKPARDLPNMEVAALLHGIGRRPLAVDFFARIWIGRINRSPNHARAACGRHRTEKLQGRGNGPKKSPTFGAHFQCHARPIAPIRMILSRVAVMPIVVFVH